MLTVYDVMPKEFREALADPLATDISVRDSGKGYIKRLGVLTEIELPKHIVPLILCFAANDAGTVINDEVPTLECSLRGGERTTGKRPEAGIGWTVTIRSPVGRRLTWDEQIALGTVTKEQANWIESRVSEGSSGVVVGGMGSGKTTMLSTILGSQAFAGKIAVKLEAVEELIGPPVCTTYLIGEHCSMKTAREKALREDAQIFIVGEARGGEEMAEVMTTMGTGHQSFTTLHADGIEDVPFRIEDMLRQNTDSRTQEQIHATIVRNIDFCIYMRNIGGGKRVVSDIAAFEMKDGIAVRKEVYTA